MKPPLPSYQHTPNPGPLFTIRICENNWLPLSELFMHAMGWKAGNYLTLEIVGDTVLITRKEP